MLPREVLEGLAPKPGDFFVDGTLGGGGHTQLLAETVGETGTVLAMDRDIQAIDRADTLFQRQAAGQENLKRGRIRLAHANYCDFPEALEMLGVAQVDGFLLDVGLSSDQLADRSRGFSFESDGPLDLRFDTSEGVPAYELLEKWSEEQIANTIYQYGEEKFSFRIAKKLIQCRRENCPIRTAAELADLVRSCVPPQRKFAGRPRNTARSIPIDPATRTFQALRIAVNDELGSLQKFLTRVCDHLKPGGRVAIISFHSLEDRIVKNAFRDDPSLEILTKKPILASDDEVQTNPRSRSAKLRIAARR